MPKKKYPYLEPGARECVDAAKKEPCKILMMVDGYKTDLEALHLRDLLWYARDKGVEITIVPADKIKQHVI